MKKTVSIILAVLVAFPMVFFNASAAKEEPVPLIIMRGYSGPHLAYADENGNPVINEDGTVKKAWPLDTDKLLKDAAEIMPSVGIGKITFYEAIVELFKRTLAPLQILPDGTSVNNLVAFPSGGAENTRVSYLIENGMTDVISETELIEYAKENGLSEDEIFCFTHDWRKSQLEYAESLDAYIQQVKALTGSDKVDLFGLSHSGQYGSTYLYYYGRKGDVRKAIFANPATLGTTICGSLFTGEELDFDFETLMTFVQHSLETEENFEELISLIPLEHLIPILNDILKEPEIQQSVMAIPSLWDLVPADRFDEALSYAEKQGLSVWPDGKISDDLLENSKTYHREVAADGRLAKKLKALTEGAEPVQIGYIVGTGYGALNGGGNNSDYIIDTYLSSGADCAKLGEAFQSDYKQANENCSDPGHYHISPEFDIDASTGFLPDSTWYINGQGHGMFIIDEYSANLITEFLWGDVVDVYSDKAYPQFNISQNTSESVYARFNNTSSGYHTTQDTELLIKNMSVASDLIIWDIESTGADINFDYKQGVIIRKGEEISIAVTDNDFVNSSTPFTVEITYTLENLQLTTVTDSLKFTALSDNQARRFRHILLNDMSDAEIPDTGSQPFSSYAAIIMLTVSFAASAMLLIEQCKRKRKANM